MNPGPAISIFSTSIEVMSILSTIVWAIFLGDVLKIFDETSATFVVKSPCPFSVGTSTSKLNSFSPFKISFSIANFIEFLTASFILKIVFSKLYTFTSPFLIFFLRKQLSQ